MPGKQLQAVVDAFREYIFHQGWLILGEEDVQNGLRLLVTDGITKVPIYCYTNGNALIQGPASSLRTDLQTWWQQRKASVASPMLQDTVIPLSLQTIVETFRAFALSQGWTLAGKAISARGYQLRFIHNGMTVPIDFHSQGKVLIQGNPSVLRDTVQNWWKEHKAQQGLPLWEMVPIQSEQVIEDAPASLPLPSVVAKTVFVPRIGSDEAGKGDYFGPLVVAGVYVNEQTASQLTELGVRDSKLLPDTQILLLAQEIKAICHGQGYIVAYRPERYNQLYSELSNLNLLLAKAHAQVIMNIQKNVACTFALVDQFGNESLVSTALQDANCQITLEQRPHAEDDIAVAAASIIARAEFVRQIDVLSQNVGVQLPKGASDVSIVTVGKEIVAKHGQDELGKVAKLHFKTTQMIL